MQPPPAASDAEQPRPLWARRDGADSQQVEVDEDKQQRLVARHDPHVATHNGHAHCYDNGGRKRDEQQHAKPDGCGEGHKKETVRVGDGAGEDGDVEQLEVEDDVRVDGRGVGGGCVAGSADRLRQEAAHHAGRQPRHRAQQRHLVP